VLGIQNEFDPLELVILGTGIGMKAEADPVLQQGLPKTSAFYTQPDPKLTEWEFAGVCHALENLGTVVRLPDIVDSPEVVDQTCPRDIGFVIDDLYFEANSRYASRNIEHLGIDTLLKDVEPPHYIKMPKDVVLEGGDVMPAPGKLFLGLGARSSREGIEWLASVLHQHGSTREIVIIPHDVLHLDCCWNVIGPDLALWCEAATGTFMDLEGAPAHMDFETISVNRAEQAALATNVLVARPGHILTRDDAACESINQILESRYGFSVERLPFDCVPSIGGSFRCATLPLKRG
jgi:N-dimethylarginine dimethylaminohydrolase